MNRSVGLNDLLEWASPGAARVPVEEKQCGIGMVGFGQVARRWHMKAYERLGLRVVGVCDSSPEAQAEWERLFPSLRWFASYEEMLANREAMIIDIATRPTGREELIAQAVDAIKHVLAQKPARATHSFICSQACSRSMSTPRMHAVKIFRRTRSASFEPQDAR